LKIVLGLGNPGSAYRGTRHNLGFWVLDRVARRNGARFRVTTFLKRYAWCAEIERGATALVLAKPRTYMNRSGRAGVALLRRHDARPDQMLVVHDDADLEFGRLRVRRGGGPGGHNGIRSLIDVLGTRDFPRLRLGVRGKGRDGRDLAEYVLDEFLPDEVPLAEDLADLAADAIQDIVKEGLEAAMNRYNGRRVGNHDPGSGPD
jgi:PTH1 family peptidyl-tRNA hydrolase